MSRVAGLPFSVRVHMNKCNDSFLFIRFVLCSNSNFHFHTSQCFNLFIFSLKMLVARFYYAMFI